MELAFFRVLQEALTNVHRYSKSSVVDVVFGIDAEEAFFTARDYGRGFPAEIVKRFREHGSGVGVGLSGMRERMKELGGSLELSSDAQGTTVRVTVPGSKSQTRWTRPADSASVPTTTPVARPPQK